MASSRALLHSPSLIHPCLPLLPPLSLFSFPSPLSFFIWTRNTPMEYVTAVIYARITHLDRRETTRTQQSKVTTQWSAISISNLSLQLDPHIRACQRERETGNNGTMDRWKKAAKRCFFSGLDSFLGIMGWLICETGNAVFLDGVVSGLQGED